MTSISNFGTQKLACFLLFLLLESGHCFRKYDSSHLELLTSSGGNGMEERNLSTLSKPLSTRIRKLPPRYSQHYFSPFHPVQADSKTFVSIPSNAANFFGPQSYWAQMANRLIDNVVDTVGGHYASEKAKSKTAKSKDEKMFTSSEERMENFRIALKSENATKLQYPSQQPLPLPEFKETDNLHEIGIDVRYPRIQYSDKSRNSFSSAEVVQPRRIPVTLSPTAAYPPPPTTPSPSSYSRPPTEYGILPSLLLKNPNARSKFYRLDKYANPQYAPGIPKRKRPVPSLQALPAAASTEYGRDSEFYQAASSEIRRKPASSSRIPSSSYYGNSGESREQQIFKEIKFRSALKKILADFRRHHPSSFRPSNGRSRELSQIAQHEGSQSTRRRRPQNRRIVHLPSRYGSTEEFKRW